MQFSVDISSFSTQYSSAALQFSVQKVQNLFTPAEHWREYELFIHKAKGIYRNINDLRNTGQ